MGLLTIAMRVSVIKNFDLQGIKDDTYKKKIKPAVSNLVDLQDDSLVMQNCL